ncbi:MAG TPA: hypothetical protein VMF89_36110, partial [Polyangiales bacterium]|nr:hypothetical protein [Polyangiales bacterium]
MPQASDPVLQEAVIRVRGELSAMGLRAEVTPSAELDTDTESEDVRGALSLERDGPWLRIRARGAKVSTPIVQELDA